MDEQAHWNAIYRSKAQDAVSWYRPHLEQSLRFIEEAALPRTAAIVDVGGGASTLVDDLLDAGYSNLTVLDLSASAIEQAQRRLGTRARAVTWLVGDVTQLRLPDHAYDFWHDRAVFHFLRDEGTRRQYVAAARRALRPNAYIVVATFGLAGPKTCSGLPVMRYTAEGIHEQFGEEFLKVGETAETHRTPWGSEQEFVYCYCRVPAAR